jgi:chemotaxis protein MotB
MSRRRKKKHEEHLNHEAWAIPYGDLITLLLAFFVVMYAISSVNEGKYRVLSDALFAAFRGAPRTLEPVQVGEKQVGSGADVRTTLVEQSMLQGQPRSMLAPIPIETGLPKHPGKSGGAVDPVQSAQAAAAAGALERVADEVLRAMDVLIRANLVFVRHQTTYIEVEIRTDILFPSGSATLSDTAIPVIQKLGNVLKPFPNAIRVEGHTDSRPIATVAFPSNWELSAARAASVVHLFASVGVQPARLAVIGHGEFRPAQSNDTPEGRNANRRVVIVILSTDGTVPQGAAPEATKPADETVPPASAPAAPALAAPVAPSPAVASPAQAGAPAAAPPTQADTTPAQAPTARVEPVPGTPSPVAAAAAVARGAGMVSAP